MFTQHCLCVQEEIRAETLTPINSTVKVRTLRRVWPRRLRLVFNHFHFKADRQLFRWVAGGVIASLVLQKSMKRIFSRQNTLQRTNDHVNGEVPGVDVQFFVGSEWKTSVDSIGI